MNRGMTDDDWNLKTSCCFVCREVIFTVMKCSGTRRSSQCKGLVPAQLSGACCGSVPREKERFFRHIPASILPEGRGQGVGSRWEAFSVHSSWAAVGGPHQEEGDHQ